MLKLCLGLCTALLMASAGSAAINPYESANLIFSRNPALNRNYEEVRVGFLRRDPQSRAQILWARRAVKPRDGTEQVSWTDSKSCPALIEAMRKLPDLEMPQPHPLGIDADETDIVLDGIGYSLRGQASYGRRSADFELQSNVDTPLARWVEETMSVLQPCWTAQEPSRD